MKTVKTPEYWKKEQFQPLIEVETAYGNKVKIPEKLKVSYEVAKKRKAFIEKEQPDFLDGYIQEVKEEQDSRYLVEQVFYEVFEELN